MKRSTHPIMRCAILPAFLFFFVAAARLSAQNCAAPTQVRITSLSATHATISWAPAAGALGYRVVYQSNTSQQTALASGSLTAVVARQAGATAESWAVQAYYPGGCVSPMAAARPDGGLIITIDDVYSVIGSSPCDDFSGSSPVYVTVLMAYACVSVSYADLCGLYHSFPVQAQSPLWWAEALTELVNTGKYSYFEPSGEGQTYFAQYPAAFVNCPGGPGMNRALSRELAESLLEVGANPFGNTLSFSIQASGHDVSNVLTLSDLSGRVLQTIKLPALHAGEIWQGAFNTESFAPGVYLLRLQSERGAISRKVLKNR